jgi:hypothetical protein
MRRTTRVSLAFVLCAALAAGAAYGAAALTSVSTQTIKACQLKALGTIRIVADQSRCNANLETYLEWNIQGANGDAGLPGTAGATGAKGEKGDIGATGARGTDGVAGVNGAAGAQGPKGDAAPAATLASLSRTACAAGGHDGTLAISVAAGGDVTLHCDVAPTTTLPLPPQLLSVNAPATVPVGGQSAVTVVLDAAAPANLTVMISSSDPGVISIASSLVIPAGQTQATTTLSGLTPGEASITATLGAVSKSTGQIRVTTG